MPYITVEEDVDITDILSDCSDRELKEAARYIIREAVENDTVKGALIDEMINESDSFSSELVREFKKGEGSYSPLEQEHISKMELLSSKFYVMSNEDLALLEAVYSKYK